MKDKENLSLQHPDYLNNKDSYLSSITDTHLSIHSNQNINKEHKKRTMKIPQWTPFSTNHNNEIPTMDVSPILQSRKNSTLYNQKIVHKPTKTIHNFSEDEDAYKNRSLLLKCFEFFFRYNN